MATNLSWPLWVIYIRMFSDGIQLSSIVNLIITLFTRTHKIYLQIRFTSIGTPGKRRAIALDDIKLAVCEDFCKFLIYINAFRIVVARLNDWFSIYELLLECTDMLRV